MDLRLEDRASVGRDYPPVIDAMDAGCSAALHLRAMHGSGAMYDSDAQFTICHIVPISYELRRWIEVRNVRCVWRTSAISKLCDPVQSSDMQRITDTASGEHSLFLRPQ